MIGDFEGHVFLARFSLIAKIIDVGLPIEAVFKGSLITAGATFSRKIINTYITIIHTYQNLIPQ